MTSKSSRGRPFKLEPKFCEMLINHMSGGYSYESFAAVVGVTPKTLYNWEKQPEWKEAKEIAFAKCRLHWEGLGIKHVVNLTVTEKSGRESTSESTSLNASVWIFNMKNRFGWKDKQAGEAPDVAVNVDNSTNIEKMTDEQLDQLIAAKEKSLKGKK